MTSQSHAVDMTTHSMEMTSQPHPAEMASYTGHTSPTPVVTAMSYAQPTAPSPPPPQIQSPHAAYLQTSVGEPMYVPLAGQCSNIITYINVAFTALSAGRAIVIHLTYVSSLVSICKV